MLDVQAHKLAVLTASLRSRKVSFLSQHYRGWIRMTFNLAETLVEFTKTHLMKTMVLCLKFLLFIVKKVLIPIYLLNHLYSLGTMTPIGQKNKHPTSFVLSFGTKL